jgi:hypothetical protein
MRQLKAATTFDHNVFYHFPKQGQALFRLVDVFRRHGQGAAELLFVVFR